MIVALLLSLVAVIYACWLLYTLATLALPVFAAVSLGFWVHAMGTGVAGAIGLGLLGGVITLTGGQLLFAILKSPIWRLALGLLFSVPAAFAGYHAVHGITGVGLETEAWRQTLAIIGALAIGVSAWMRIAGGGDVVRRIERDAPSAS